MPFNKFAHLMGFGARAAEGEDEDKDAKKAKGQRADEDDYDESAEDGEDDEKAEEDDGGEKAEDDGEDAPKGKKAKGKRAQDDDEDEGSASASVAKGRRLERQRCAAIFGSKAAGVRPDMAASLAFGTSLSASAAINQLEMAAAVGAPQGGRMSLDQRMQSVQQHRLAPDAKAPQASGPQGAASHAVALYNRHKGIK